MDDHERISVNSLAHFPESCGHKFCRLGWLHSSDTAVKVKVYLCICINNFTTGLMSKHSSIFNA